MNSKLTLFSQIISKIDRGIFKKIVIEKKTDYQNKGFDSWTHLVSMLFCHFAKALRYGIFPMDFVAQRATSII